MSRQLTECVHGASTFGRIVGALSKSVYSRIGRLHLVLTLRQSYAQPNVEHSYPEPQLHTLPPSGVRKGGKLTQMGAFLLEQDVRLLMLRRKAWMVRMVGLEPTRPKSLEPKSNAAAYYATLALSL